MTSTEQRSQIATTGRLALWVLVAGLVIAFIGVAVMSADAVMTGGVIAVVGLVAVVVCAALKMFGKR